MKKKFTLLELLIVVAIIGMLVSILLPSLTKARNKARKALCLSHLSQASKLMFDYALKNNNVLFSSRGIFYTSIRNSSHKTFWSLYSTGAESPYEIFGCPMFNELPDETSKFINHPHIAGQNWTDSTGEVFSSSSLLEQTSSTVLTQDLIYQYSTTDWRSNHSSGTPLKTWDETGYIFIRDTVPFGVNIAYGDGSARWAPLSKLSIITVAAQANIWSTPK
jgi:prepilin-type N-terminal cleavage/methylation domain-containing protein